MIYFLRLSINNRSYNKEKPEGLEMPFAEKLAKLRKDKGFTQQELAQRAGIGIAQMRRYEKGNSSPTLEVIKNIAKTLAVTTDELIFDEGEGIVPSKIQDKELLEQFEQISTLTPQDKEALKTIIESMIIKSKLQQIMPSRTDAAWSKEMRGVVAEFRKGAKDYSDKQIESIVDEAVDAARKTG
jgi:transcriptional regulator with XRE-family HTH domain